MEPSGLRESVCLLPWHTDMLAVINVNWKGAVGSEVWFGFGCHDVTMVNGGGALHVKMEGGVVPGGLHVEKEGGVVDFVVWRRIVYLF
jgi:hypothetical protein